MDRLREGGRVGEWTTWKGRLPGRMGQLEGKAGHWMSNQDDF